MLSAGAILDLWEAGSGKGPLTRGVLLSAVTSGLPPSQIWDAPVGKRNLDILHLRAAAFGDTMPSVAECPQCHQQVEFSLSAASLQSLPPPADSHRYEFHSLAGLVRFRVPRSRDLLAASRTRSQQEAEETLLSLCVLDGLEASAPPLPFGIVHRNGTP